MHSRTDWLIGIQSQLVAEEIREGKPAEGSDRSRRLRIDNDVEDLCIFFIVRASVYPRPVHPQSIVCRRPELIPHILGGEIVGYGKFECLQHLSSSRLTIVSQGFVERSEVLYGFLDRIGDGLIGKIR